MNSQILALYRCCMKQTIKIKPKDQNIYNAILSALHDKKGKISQKSSINILANLTKLITRVNQGDEKSTVKLVRIFTNTSQMVTSNLELSPHYGTTAMRILQSDIEFQQLNQKDKDYVTKVIRRICDKKPTYKYKSVEKYLESLSSQNAEIEMMHMKNRQSASEQQLEKLSSASKWSWAYQNILLRKQDKIDQIVKQMVERKIFIL